MTYRPVPAIRDERVPLPKKVVALAGTDEVTLVWRNQLGGVTFRLDDGASGIRFVKWAAPGAGDPLLAGEAARLGWAAQWITVPRVIESGSDESGTWLVTGGIDAASAVDPRWLADPLVAVSAIGRGLRQLHDRLPVDDCPFEWPASRRIQKAIERAREGMTTDEWFPEHRSLTIEAAMARLDDVPPIDRLVVCHGDACAPNTLIDRHGAYAAHVDFGSMGVADRWADIAVAAWSTEWNYGTGFTEALYESYGIVPDQQRIDYYRLLWDLS